MENNKLSTGLTVWLWIIFVLNILATIGGIVVALGASVVGATLGLGSIYVVLCFISVILQIIITVSIGILLFAHKKIGLVLIFAFAALGFIVSMVTYSIAAQLRWRAPVRRWFPRHRWKSPDPAGWWHRGQTLPPPA